MALKIVYRHPRRPDEVGMKIVPDELRYGGEEGSRSPRFHRDRDYHCCFQRARSSVRLKAALGPAVNLP